MCVSGAVAAGIYFFFFSPPSLPFPLLFFIYLFSPPPPRQPSPPSLLPACLSPSSPAAAAAAAAPDPGARLCPPPPVRVLAAAAALPSSAPSLSPFNHAPLSVCECRQADNDFLSDYVQSESLRVRGPLWSHPDGFGGLASIFHYYVDYRSDSAVQDLAGL